MNELVAAQHADAKPDFPGLEKSKYAQPNLLCEPLINPLGDDDK